MKHLKSVLSDISYKKWMVRISPKTAKASGTNGKSVSIRAHSVSLPYVQRVSENGLSSCSKNKELAHSTSLNLISSVSIWSTTKIRHPGNKKKKNVELCRKLSANAVMISLLETA